MDETGPMGRRDLFRLIADEAFRDGVVEPHENAILQQMARFLRLTAEEAQGMAREALARFQSGALGEARPLSPTEVYGAAERLVLADGEIDAEEEQLLRGLRLVLGLPEGLAPESEAPVVPEPGSSTTHLGARLEVDVMEAWRQEHGIWYQVEDGCSPAAREGFFQFRIGLLRRDEEEMYRGLDMLDDVCNAPPGGDIDGMHVLRALRTSRLLLRTARGAQPMDPPRVWPEEALYRRLMVKMAAPLITVRFWRQTPNVDIALGLCVAYLFDDLAALVAARRGAALAYLTRTLPLLCQAAEKLAVTHQAAAVLELLSGRLVGDETTVRVALVDLCRELCAKLAPNHPLALAADLALGRIAPEQRVFPAGHAPPPAKPGRECSGAAQDRLARVVARVGAEAEAEAALAPALAAAAPPAVDGIFGSASESAAEAGLPVDEYRGRYLVVHPFPELEGWPRPVIAFYSGSDHGVHQAELKGGWIHVQGAREDSGLRVLTGFPRAEGTNLLGGTSPPEPLAAALDASGGAYDVALVSYDRQRVRVWHQAGDFDPSGNVQRVEAELLPAERIDEAREALQATLARHPWCSAAHVHLGLIAKRAGDLDEAQACFERALAVQPHDYSARARLGVLAKQAGDLEGATRWLDEALRVNPTDEATALTLASVALSRAASGEGVLKAVWDYVMAGLGAFDPASPDWLAVLDAGRGIDPRYAQHVPTLEPDAGYAV